jgi:hypothetical protein
MSMDGSRRLGPGARRRIVEQVRAGISPATVNRWVKRERGPATCSAWRGAGRWIASWRPHRSPTVLGDDEHDRICEVREHTGWGPRLLAPAEGAQGGGGPL